MSAASFKNILVHYLVGKKVVSEESNVNDLLMQENNRFYGWECWAGLQNITIDNQGKVWRAICRQGECLGSIYEDFTFPADVVICKKQACNCAADIQLSKCHPDHRKSLRVGNNKKATS